MKYDMFELWCWRPAFRYLRLFKGKLSFSGYIMRKNDSLKKTIIIPKETQLKLRQLTDVADDRNE